MAGDAVKFGEAFVEIHARLDEYDREIAAAEQRTTQAIDRVEQRARGAGAALQSAMRLRFEATNGQSLLDQAGPGTIEERLGIASAITSATLWGHRLQWVLGLFRSIGRFMASGALLPVALIVGFGDLFRTMEKIPPVIRRIGEFLRNLTLDEVLGAVERAGDALREFIVKIPLLGSTASLVSRALGGPDLKVELEEQAAAMRHAKIATEALLEARKRFASSDAMTDAIRQSRRELQMLGADEFQRVQLETLFSKEDLIREAREVREQLPRILEETIKDLRGQLAAGQIGREEFDIRFGTEVNVMNEAIRRNAQELQKALAAATETGRAKLQQLDREQAAERAIEIAQLQAQIAQARADLELEGFDRQAAAIRIGYRLQLAQAERDGAEHRIALIEELAQLQLEAARQQERQRWDAQVDEARRGALKLRDRLHDTQREIERVELELATPAGSGRDLMLQRFDIDARAQDQVTQFQRKIEELRQQQGELVADTLHSPKAAAELEMIQKQIDRIQQLINLEDELRLKRSDLAEQRINESMRAGSFRQVDLLRDLPGSPGAAAGAAGPSGVEQQTEREQLREQKLSREELQAIRRALENGVPAFAN